MKVSAKKRLPRKPTKYKNGSAEMGKKDYGSVSVEELAQNAEAVFEILDKQEQEDKKEKKASVEKVKEED